MGLSKKFRLRLSELEKFNDSQIDDLKMDMPSIQRSIFNRLRLILKDLDLDKQGKIKPTQKNIKLINKIDLTDLIFTDKYIKAVSDFTGSFDEIAKKTDKLYADIR